MQRSGWHFKLGWCQGRESTEGDNGCSAEASRDQYDMFGQYVASCLQELKSRHSRQEVQDHLCRILRRGNCAPTNAEQQK